MMKKGMPLAAIEKEFQMKAFSEWDRTEHLPWIAATIHRELQGLGPQIITVTERRLNGVVSSAVQDGRFVTVTTGDGTQVRLRVTGDTVFEGIADRTEMKPGMKVSACTRCPRASCPRWVMTPSSSPSRAEVCSAGRQAPAHAQLTSCFRSGRLRTRFPVTRNTALTIAGGICAIASSPTPSSQ